MCNRRLGWLVVPLVALLFTALPAIPASATQEVERVIVTFLPNTTTADQQSYTDRVGEPKRQVDDRRVAVEVDGEGRRALERHPRVATVEQDGRVRATRVPNDPCYGGCAAGSQWALPAVRAPAAWDVTRGSSAVTVAVLDTGVDGGHPDLRSRLASSKLYASSSTATDLNGHGTAVAGIIAAIANNGQGIAGMAWDVRLLSGKVLDDQGAGFTSDLAAGIRTATDDGATVINVSAAGPPSAALADAVAYATARNALVVAAAGNGGTSDPSNSYPAAYDQVLAVGATGQDGARASFSDYGSWVDIAAPGVNVLSTARGGYVTGSGTSFSSPIVAGAAALLRSTHEGTTGSFVRQRLLATARLVGLTGDGLGSGLLDAGGALAGLTPCESPGYLLDGWGGLHPSGGAAATGGGPYWPGFDIARDLVIRPQSPSQGYVLDGYGGVHPFGGAPGVAASSYWPGWDIANAFAVRPDGNSGYVLDGYGGVHPFGGAPGVAATGYWPGWDIARDVAVSPANPSTGWVLDGYGGIHPFGGAPGVAATGYWPGWDIARKIVLNPANPSQGWVLDGQGGLHPFATGGTPLPATPANYSYPTSPARDAVATSAGGGQVMTGYGSVVGLGAPGCPQLQRWPGWDIARAFAAGG